MFLTDPQDIDPAASFNVKIVKSCPLGSGIRPGGNHINQALTRQDALRGMTTWAALANFEEDRKGSLEPGKAADFILMDRDILKVSEQDVLRARVLGTWIAGEQVYEFY